MKKNICPASFYRCSEVEDEFALYGYEEWTGELDQQPAETWCFATIPRKKIDVKASRGNMARPDGAINRENIAWMKASLAAGSKFRAAVVVWQPNGTAKLIDGNHRDESCPDGEYMNVYSFKTANTAIERVITKTLNQKNGLGASPEVRLANAVSEVEAGMGEEAAEKKFGVSRAKIREQLALRKFQISFSQEVPKAMNLDTSVQRSLADSIKPLSITVATELAQIATEVKGVNAQNIKDFTEKYKNAATAREQQALRDGMRSHIERMAGAGTLGGTLPVATKPKKKVANKVEVLKFAEKTLCAIRRPQANLAADFTASEIVTLTALCEALRDIIKKN